MKRFVPLLAATTLAGCVPPGYPTSIVNLQPIPATQAMSVDAAEKLVDEKMGVIGWSRAPKAYEQNKKNQYNICSIGGSMSSPIRFANLSSSSFVATSAKGFASFYFTQPGHDCPAQLFVNEITRGEAEGLASALAVLASAERSGLRQSSDEPDRDQWTKIARSNDPADFQSFVMTYPSSSLSDQAYDRLIETRRAMAVAKAAKGRKAAVAPLQPPPAGLVVESVSNFGKAGGTAGTITTRTKVVSGDLANFVEETSSIHDTTTADGSRVHTSSQMVYRGPYGLLGRTGKSSGTTKTRTVLSSGGVSNSSSTTETWREGGNGDMNSLFPLKIGNVAKEKYFSNTSVTVSSELSTGAPVLLGRVGNYKSPPTTHNTRSEHEGACIVEDYKKVKISGGNVEAVKVFCASKYWVTINNGKSVYYTFTDSYYSAKHRAIVKTITSTTGSPVVTETNYNVISSPG